MMSAGNLEALPVFCLAYEWYDVISSTALHETEAFVPINHHEVGLFFVNILVLRYFVLRHQQVVKYWVRLGVAEPL